MHSGADVEAFTAALNREVEGSASTSTSAAAASSSSQPLDHADGEPPAHYPRRLFPVLEPNSGCPVFPPQQPGVRVPPFFILDLDESIKKHNVECSPLLICYYRFAILDLGCTRWVLDK
jgi:transcription initiation factor TFIID subunit 4